MELPFCTIGHSTRSLEAFVALLRVAEVELVVDIRTVPRSRTNPQYNSDSIGQSLAAFHVGYERLPALGGLRHKATGVAAEVNGLWRNQSFHNYADYALSDAFRVGLARLIELGRERRCAVMCAETLWWRCHRRIVADHLLAHGEVVFHLMGRDRMEPAHLTAGAHIQASGAVTYPG